ncbi:MAG: hypothetical protein ACXWG0_03750, partial [Chthoniobacterales bacterium]
LQSLALSMAGRELGDRKLSILFAIGYGFAVTGMEHMAESMKRPDLMSKSITEVLEILLEESDEMVMEWGNRRNVRAFHEIARPHRAHE